MLFQGSQKKQEQLVLKVSGSPFEMGYQHGSSLKKKVQENIENHLKKPFISQESQEKTAQFLKALPSILPHIPSKYIEEMKGLAEGAEVSFSDILLLNLFPEMFHCCAVTAKGKASLDGTLYHVRVLDYAVGKNLQSSAVLIVATPNDGFSFLNVSYAGFIGSVTGMNALGISIGEIGGLGYGNWNGVPMSFLLRSILEEAQSLEDAKNIISSSKRTCEYYYIIADGKTNTSFACYATSSQVQFLSCGEDYSITPGATQTEDLSFQIKPKQINPLPATLMFSQPEDTILLTGFIAADRYPILEKRILERYGRITQESLMEIIKEPVAKPSNLHNAIFHPSSLTVWISHAGSENQPACNEAYSRFNLHDLLGN